MIRARNEYDLALGVESEAGKIDVRSIYRLVSAARSRTFSDFSKRSQGARIRCEPVAWPRPLARSLPMRSRRISGRSQRDATGRPRCGWPAVAAVMARRPDRRSTGCGRWTREGSRDLATVARMSGRLPEHIVGSDALTLRRWTRDDAAQLGEAVTESLEHLRPWMPWIAHEPLSVTDRRALIDSWHEEWLAGGDVVMGVFLDGAVAGACGLHRRIGPGGLEIGYWTARRFLRQGIATRAAGLLTDGAFSDAAITRVENPS
jgi:ribosomal-protein-serine acetyltransferase